MAPSVANVNCTSIKHDKYVAKQAVHSDSAKSFRPGKLGIPNDMKADAGVPSGESRVRTRKASAIVSGTFRRVSLRIKSAVLATFKAAFPKSASSS